ncbi:hypothetical protein UPYG_G00157350 [Umbra pygmaea]|uniref:Centrosomal protein of 72 kDa n=1 Tax=Umbra pygmaea TaxID=75934 RepID=A0ABD0X2Y9_UMBPY
MAALLTTITEQWIREKLRLNHHCLADVRSLCLPGSHKEKIRHLGISLKNFVRLKTLDLSCNALISVEGVQHLKKLEKLNLYYNRIPSIQEVKVLFRLTTLRELDLRLNPLAAADPQYRLYLVHALVNLRVLDDCPVRDTERRVSLMHFSSDSTIRPQQMISSKLDKSETRSGDLRIASVNHLTKKLSVLDDADDILLNLVAKSNWGKSNPQILTGSFHKDPESQLYHQIKDESRRAQSTGLQMKTSEGLRVTFNPGVEEHSRSWSVHKERGKLHKHLRVPAKGHFTPHPDQGEQSQRSLVNIRAPSPRSPAPNISDASNPILHPPRLSYHISPQPAGGSTVPQTNAKHQKGRNRKSMKMLLRLVHKHWRGEGPPNQDSNLLSQAVQILAVMEEELSSREDEVRNLRQSFEDLKEQADLRDQEQCTEKHSLTAQLQEAHSSVDRLNEHLRMVLEENVHLQKQLIKLEQQHLNSMMRSSPISEQGLCGKQMEVDQLRREVAELREEVREGDRLTELTDMLQENHRSLVATNECLLENWRGPREEGQLHVRTTKTRRPTTTTPGGTLSR